MGKPSMTLTTSGEGRTPRTKYAGPGRPYSKGTGMEFSPQQDQALMAVDKWLKSGEEQVFRLFGYAGTGKTTLARYFASNVDGDVRFGAYTGKAAYVLQQKGCSGASTIHSMIYKAREKGKSAIRDMENQLSLLLQELADEEEDTDKNPQVAKLHKLIKEERKSLKEPFFVLNSFSDIRESALIVIDECSMVDGRMAEDLLSFGTKVLVLGDPAQLPPVGGAGYFTEGVTPNIMLEEIHRQAQESPILRMATQVRLAQPLSLGDYGDGCSYTDQHIDPAEALNYDQILVGKNKTRFATNKRVRTLKGIEDPFPVIDDRLVCLRNNHDEGLLNGAIFKVVEVTGVGDRLVDMIIDPDTDQKMVEVKAHDHYFLGQGDDIPWFRRKEANEFDYGYALTVHKSQGSQWDSVLLFDESYCFREDKWRWLYTGITRAAERLTIVRT